MSNLTPRGRALRWMTEHRGTTEQPDGSNYDNRPDGIRAAQRRIGSWVERAPWCGTWCYSALRAAGVQNLTGRMASVAFIEDDAKLKKHCYRGWTTNPRLALRGDLVVLFGRGVHVEMVRSTAWLYRRLGLIRTEGGNTASGVRGSQSNGNTSAVRLRRLKDVRGFALIDFPNR